ncbi:putative membrane protein [Clostridium bornimense]|uniref:histidine kinase n=1 Tax=Clostridium bornimense TaxID=1216932 RepID=W6S2H3_9CLOT|nr:methyl-accepting chemotaxis protein [Clostridium bornimense]CDM70104.1 putative membrane protein [Clostridium bornimense]
MKKSKKLRSIKTVLILGTLLLVIVPPVIVSAISLRVTSVAYNEMFSTNSETLTNIGTNFINSEIKRYTDIMNSLSDSNLYEKIENNIEKEVLYDTFNNILQCNTSLVDVYYSDKKGNLIIGSRKTLPSDYNALEQSWFKDNINSDKEFSITNSYKDTNTDEMVVSMYKSIMKDGNSLGVLGLDINLSKLSEALLYVKQGDEGDIAVVDNTDKIIISSNSNLVGSNEQLNYDKWKYISLNNNGLVTSKYNSDKYKISFNTEELTGWKVFVKVPLSEIYASRNKLILINGMSTVGLLLISSIIVVIASLRVSKLVCKVQEGLNRVADCEFNFRLNVNGTTTEFKEVEESFNKMQSNIAHLVNQVSSSIDVVNKETEDSVTISTNILTSMNDVSNTINQIADGTMHSSSDLDDISSKLEELSNNMNNIKNIVE